jgi:hypothetical protein
LRQILSDKSVLPTFKSKDIRKDYVAVSLHKPKSKDLIREIQIAIAWALNHAGVTNLDITLKENDDSIDVIIET